MIYIIISIEYYYICFINIIQSKIGFLRLGDVFLIAGDNDIFSGL